MCDAPQPPITTNRRIAVPNTNRERSRRVLANVTSIASANTHSATGCPESGVGHFFPDGPSKPDVVPTVTVAVWSVTPFVAATEVGEMLQLEFVGKPLHDKATDPVNPPSGVIVIVSVPLEPLFTFSADGAVIVNPTPDPLNAIVCAVVLSLAVIERVALLDEALIGANVTLMEQPCPGVKVTGALQVFVWEKMVLAGEIEMELTVRFALPALVMLTVCAVAGEFRKTCPKVMLVGEIFPTPAEFVANPTRGIFC